MDKTAVGRTGSPVTMHIERGKIREFARAIKDEAPVYFDAELARKTAGGIPAPPTFLMTAVFWADASSGVDLQLDYYRLLHGEQEFEYFMPLRAGDVLTGVSKCEKIFEKQGGRGGTMTFAVVATEFRNQQGELVAISRSTLIETGQVVKAG